MLSNLPYELIEKVFEKALIKHEEYIDLMDANMKSLIYMMLATQFYCYDYILRMIKFKFSTLKDDEHSYFCHCSGQICITKSTRRKMLLLINIIKKFKIEDVLKCIEEHIKRPAIVDLIDYIINPRKIAIGTIKIRIDCKEIEIDIRCDRPRKDFNLTIYNINMIKTYCPSCRSFSYSCCKGKRRNLTENFIVFILINQLYLMEYPGISVDYLYEIDISTYRKRKSYKTNDLVTFIESGCEYPEKSKDKITKSSFLDEIICIDRYCAILNFNLPVSINPKPDNLIHIYNNFDDKIYTIYRLLDNINSTYSSKNFKNNIISDSTLKIKDKYTSLIKHLCKNIIYKNNFVLIYYIFSIYSNRCFKISSNEAHNISNILLKNIKKAKNKETSEKIMFIISFLKTKIKKTTKSEEFKSTICNKKPKNVINLN